MAIARRKLPSLLLSSVLLVSPVCSGDFNQDGSSKHLQSRAARNWEERCLEVGGREVLSSFVAEQEQLMLCFVRNVNMERIQEQVDSNKKTGELDEIFSRYCRNEVPVIRECISRFLSVSQFCLVAGERGGLNTSMAMVDAGLSYLCHEQGDRLALFMATQGPKCLLKHREEVLQCVHKAEPGVAKRERPRMHFYVFQKENCRKGDAIIKCVETSLLKCDDPTPANLVDGLLHAMKASTPCPSSALSPAPFSFLASLSLVAYLLRGQVL